ncbi:MAG TPA: hypothetical protein PKK40_05215 [Marmoricola sp.]|nr:hypothetical protein [Marmoricola sp.]
MTAPLRPLRATVAGLTATVGAAVAHAFAGAGVPSFTALVLTLVVCTSVALALARRRLDPAGLLAVVLIGQGLLHTVFHTSGATGGNFTLMAVGHVVAALVSAAVATGAEAAIWQLLTELVQRLAPVVHLPAVCAPWRADPVGLVPWGTGRLLVIEATDRGPPAVGAL